ncbi:MAG: carbohydrate porin [Ignavibacteriaceae bacterium]|nr:carbohydrate porin [Ignavibacteriaceae bacterium]
MKTKFIFRLSQLHPFLPGYLIIILSLSMISPLSPQTSGEAPSAFQHELSYAHEFVSNLCGGLQKGNEHLGMANLRLMINPDYASLWKGGRFFVNAAMTLGGTPAGSLTGDFHGLSNIEAGKLIYIHELWYQHRFGSTIITAGLQDLNKEFLVSDNAGLLINSTFGVPAPLAGLALMPIFPHTTLGAAVQHRISESFHIQTAIYDGCPDDYENKRFNLNWKLSKQDGYTSVSELHYVSQEIGGDLSVKAGYFYHTSSRHEDESEGFRKTSSVYLIADQNIYASQGGTAAGVFLQGAVNTRLSARSFSYLGGGITIAGLFAPRPDDIISFGFANTFSAGAEDSISESILELAWKISLSEQVFIQPDVQYIINPGSASEKLNNAVVVLLRAGVTL